MNGIKSLEYDSLEERERGEGRGRDSTESLMNSKL